MSFMVPAHRLAIAVLLTGSAAFAQSGPSFDCGKAESSAEELICADDDLARLDRIVTDRYAAALAVARGLDAGAQKAEDTLRATQRGWIKGRDDCWKAENLRDCVVFSYQRREAELVAQWLLEPVTSTGFWACEGGPEVVTMFFDATLVPSLRFEVGDEIDTGTVVETGSGARYEGSFGRAIWMQGTSARYTEPNGPTYDCTLRTE